MNNGFIAIVPARAASTRLPGKMLLDVHGLPLVVRTAKQAQQSLATRVIVATDDQTIYKVVKEYGIDVLMTSQHHPSGTDRLAEAVTQLGLPDDMIVVNVQGDEPLIDPTAINQVAQSLYDHQQASIATSAYPISDVEKFFNPNVVKVICDRIGYAMYFSRAPIPWARDAFSKDKSQLPKNDIALHHIGLYAYRVGFLKQYPHLSIGQYEQWESLEQLRALEHGYKIIVQKTTTAPLAGVDTEQDLIQLRQYLSNLS